MTRSLAVLVGALSILAGCADSPTASNSGDDPRRLKSPLGYNIEATKEYLSNGGTVTAQHGELADKWWGELMRDFQAAGFPADKADSSNIRGYMKIVLHQPKDGDHSIQGPNGLVGGYWWPGSMHVPGTYNTGPMLGRRPNFQPLKHEMTHQFCIVVLGKDCTKAGDSDGWTNHVWLMPNGQNIWDLQWQSNGVAASPIAMAH